MLVLPIIRRLLDEGVLDGCDMAVAGRIVTDEAGRTWLREVRSSYFRVEDEGQQVELCIYKRGGPDLELDSVFRRFANTEMVHGVAILVEQLPNAPSLDELT